MKNIMCLNFRNVETCESCVHAKDEVDGIGFIYLVCDKYKEGVFSYTVCDSYIEK